MEHCGGCGWPTEDAYSSGHLVLSHLGLAFVLMLIPFLPELVMSTDLLSLEHPSVLLFCLSSLYGKIPVIYIIEYNSFINTLHIFENTIFI